MMKKAAYQLWLRLLRVCGLAPYKELQRAEARVREHEFQFRNLMEASGMNETACCRHHATPAQRMTQMIVCPECGSKRCNKAEICRLPCNDPSDAAVRHLAEESNQY